LSLVSTPVKSRWTIPLNLFRLVTGRVPSSSAGATFHRGEIQEHPERKPNPRQSANGAQGIIGVMPDVSFSVPEPELEPGI
jgi:hypothetical protein